MRILVAGVGNPLRGDDGFGPAVIRSLIGEGRRWHGVEFMDYGERLYDLLLVMGSYDVVVIVDAVDLGGEPGSLYLIEPGESDAPRGTVDPHGISLSDIISLASRLGYRPRKLVIVGCQPKSLSLGTGLSEEVRTCVDRAKNVVIDIIKKIIEEGDFRLS